MDTVKAQQWLIGIFSILLIVTLIIVAGVEMKKSRSFKGTLDKVRRKASILFTSDCFFSFSSWFGFTSFSCSSEKFTGIIIL